MKTELKPVKLMLGITIILLMLPMAVSAEDSNENDESNQRGSLQWQIDRVNRDRDKGTEYIQTELERRFPSLFKEETEQQIDRKMEENEDQLLKLQQSLFTEEKPEHNLAIQQVRESLFSEEYTAVASRSSQEEEEGGSMSSNVILIALSAVACFLGAGLYLMMRRMLD
ncbi:type VII secretion protein EssA [Alkalihalobacillus trypoxylicola]|uniref:Uncharacterized protein n=1 Tax=Alkalihalobacillus trypoxylicola TaxID=519424 RepID=A0A161P3D0_9BACI|nr:type VII secretion protein EssA [Alkalihalobacillus trypoxylicola]KYG26023.1 hypothetical protein AZF04_13125 [Alkalihalobacillus trypoxylicola]